MGIGVSKLLGARCAQIHPHVDGRLAPRQGRSVCRAPLAEGSSIDNLVRSLYRRSLRLALDWAVQRNLWRGQAVYIRSLFDANRNVNDPRRQRVGSGSLAFVCEGIDADWFADIVQRNGEAIRQMEAS